MKEAPNAVTADQILLRMVWEEQRKTNHLLLAAIQALRGEAGAECPECHQTFVNERALRAHMKAHKELA